MPAASRELGRVELVSTVVRADGRNMAYRRLGAGPALVCLAGGPGADARYLEDLGGLDDRYLLIVPDARGTGDSDPAAEPAGYGFDALAEDVDPLRAHLGLDDMALLAHSAACTTALVYAARHPDRLCALVLLAPSGQLRDDVDDDTGRILALRSAEPWYEAAVAARARMADGPGPDEVPSLLDAIAPAAYVRWGPREQAHAATMRPGDWETVRSFWQAGVSGPALRDDLERVEAPVLIVTGDLDAATGVAAGAAWARSFQNARHVTIAGAAHHPWVDRPRAFRELLVGFLSGADR